MTTTTTTTLLPCGDRLIIRPLEAETMTKTGIFLPDNVREKPQKGTVLAVGEGPRAESTGERAAMAFETGDTVLYSKYGGTEIEVDGEELIVLREGDVLCRLQ